jgi:hypothetical protein
LTGKKPNWILQKMHNYVLKKKNKKKAASANTALPHIHAQSPRPEKPNTRVRSAVQTFSATKKKPPFFD